MTGFITFVHITACVLLIIMILLQQSKGDGMGSAFGGGGGSQSVLGARGAATIMTKITTVLAITFMVTSLTLAYTSSQQSTDSLLNAPANTELEEPNLAPTEETQETPVAPEAQESQNSATEDTQ